MASNPATTLDIDDRWRPLTDAERIVAQSLLGDAWLLLKRADATIDLRLDAVTLDAGLVKMVLVEMVKRVLRNPDGNLQESIQDYSYTRDRVSSSGLLTVTDDELEMLAADDIAASGAFTIRPVYKIAADSSRFVADDWEWVTS